MNNSNLIFSNHFEKIQKDSSWGIKLLLSILVITLTSIVGALSIDYNELYKGMGMASEDIQASKTIGIITGAVAGTVWGGDNWYWTNLFSLLGYFKDNEIRC
jgi:hypothetical protein